MDLELMMELLFYLFKVEYNFVCYICVCKGVIKLFFVDVLIYVISFKELCMKI